MEEDKEKPRILIVEDDLEMGKSLSDVLKAKGYSPLVVLTGKEGVAAAKEEDISLALIDLKLPDIPGIEVLKEIKRSSPRTEAIVLTAYASLDTAMKAVNLGAFRYLEKLYDVGHLLLDVRRALERKWAEEALGESEKKYRNLFENTGDLLFTLDLDGKFTLVNNATERVAGCDRKDIIGKHFREFVPSKYHPLLLEAFGKEVKGIPVPTIEIEVKAKNGELIPIEILPGSIPIKEKGQLIGILITARDIAERKRAEEELEHKILAFTQPVNDLGRLKLTDIIDAAILQDLQDDFARYHGVVSVILDYNGEPIIEASNLTEFCSILRSTPKGLERCMQSDARLGKMTKKGSPAITSCPNFKEIMDGAVPIYIKGQYLGSWYIGQVLAEKLDVEEVRGYAREIGADEEKLVEAAQKLRVCSKDEFEKIVAFLNTMTRNISLLGLQNLQQARYITERKRLMNELNESHKFLETLIDNIPDTVTIRDPQHRFVLVNQAYCDITGLTKDEVIGKKTYWEKNKDVFQTGKELDIPERSFTDLNGNCHYVSVKKAPLIDESGKVANVLTISRDITEHKRLDDERERVLKELKELDKLKTNFLNVAYHEMRSPLAPIVASASLLEQGYLSAKQKRLVFIIEQSVKQLEKLINRLLELTRVDAGKVELRLKTVLIPEIIKNVLGYLKPLADAKKQSITIDVPERIEIEGDEQKITAIFDNLVSNAIKYTGKNGKIDIKAEDRGGEDIVVSIADTGIGISEEQLSRVFERFFMADTSLSRKGGLGLGLSIVQEYVKLHGGKVWATSELGKGSNIFFTVPKKQRKKNKKDIM